MKIHQIGAIVVATMMICTLHAELPSAVWNPEANADSAGNWNENASWSLEKIPAANCKAVLNVEPPVPCTVSTTAVPAQLVVGDGGPGVLIVTNGGSLITGAYGDDTKGWTAIGYDDTGRLEVHSGGAAVFKYHLWIGLTTTTHGKGDGTLVLNGGKVSVGGMFGLGWSGGKGTAQINSGTLTLADWHGTDSIKGQSVLDVAGGTVVLPGDCVASVAAFVAAKKIRAYGGTGKIQKKFDEVANKTIITAVREESGDTALKNGQ